MSISAVEQHSSGYKVSS